MTHIGKIARLPESIRNQLNQRLADGQPAKKILPSLNSHPKVKPLQIPPNCTQLQPIQEIVKKNPQRKAPGPWFPGRPYSGVWKKEICPVWRRDFGRWRGANEAHIRLDLCRVSNEASGQKNQPDRV